MSVNILFLGGGKRVRLAQEFQRAGEELGYTVNCWCYDFGDKSAFIHVGKQVSGLPWTSENLIPHLKQVVEHLCIDLVIPCVDPVIQSLYSAKVDFLGMSSGNLEPCFSKSVFESFCHSHGIPCIPQAGVLNSEFPVFIKPDCGSNSVGAMKIWTSEELGERLSSGNYIVQEFISGVEISVDVFVAKDGVLRVLSPRVRQNVSGGEVMNSVTTDASLVAELTKQIIGALQLKGAATLQFIIPDDSNQPLAMEVNPRFGGGVICTVAAGGDIPKLMLLDFLGLEVPYLRVRSGIQMYRYFAEVII